MNNEDIKLTLDGPAETPQMPVLTLDTADEPAAAEAAHKALTDERDLKQTLTEGELLAVSEFAKQIDLSNSSQMLQYGSAAQKKMLTFSESALSNVKAKDIEEVGVMISDLSGELRSFSLDEDKDKGLFGFLKKTSNKIEKNKAKYESVEKNIDKIVEKLETHKITLLKDVAVMDQLYNMNLEYYKELTMYILAGRQKIDEALNGELPALQAKAKQTGKPEDAGAANDLAERINRFEKKIHDLDLTRNICIQMGPQIRLVQGNDSMMIEKIQSSIVNTIPLWKNQMVLTLGLAHSKSAIESQRKVTDLTNELLRKNADTLKISTIEAAKESERGIVDIETLKHTNQALIATLDEVMKIQSEGRAKRREAEAELSAIESELKIKLLEIRDIKNSGAK